MPTCKTIDVLFLCFDAKGCVVNDKAIGLPITRILSEAHGQTASTSLFVKLLITVILLAIFIGRVKNNNFFN